jgi:hypothetical protein
MENWKPDVVLLRLRHGTARLVFVQQLLGNWEFVVEY